MRVLVTGASGSGTTTLGRALSRELEDSFFDVDDYYWVPTEPPYQQQRDSSARLSLLLADLSKAPQRLKCDVRRLRQCRDDENSSRGKI